MNFTETDAGIRLGIAALTGLGVGLEREWSGHTTGPNARFAGIRTFLILGVLGGIGGLFFSAGVTAAGVLAVGAGVAMTIAAYVSTVSRSGADIDGTTETAAVVVVLLGAMAGYGWLSLTAGAGSVVVLVLLEKSRLHSMVRLVDERELQAALQFAVLALVILPLLPTGPFGSTIVVAPRMLWTLVLIFSALNFAGFIARRALGNNAGYAVTGIAGGLISSTAVTLAFSHKSRAPGAEHRALMHGVIGACTVLILRVIVVSTVLNAQVGLQLCILFAAPFTAGVLLLLTAREEFRKSETTTPLPLGNPLRLGAALQMALMFQVSISLLAVVSRMWGTMGVYPAAAVLGLADMDALTLSMSRLDRGIPTSSAAFAIAVGLLTNTLLKSGVAMTVGTGPFRTQTVLRLMLLAFVSALTLAAYYFWSGFS